MRGLRPRSHALGLSPQTPLLFFDSLPRRYSERRVSLFVLVNQTLKELINGELHSYLLRLPERVENLFGALRLLGASRQAKLREDNAPPILSLAAAERNSERAILACGKDKAVVLTSCEVHSYKFRLRTVVEAVPEQKFGCRRSYISKELPCAIFGAFEGRTLAEPRPVFLENIVPNPKLNRLILRAVGVCGNVKPQNLVVYPLTALRECKKRSRRC